MTLGIPSTRASYGSINHACVPHPFVITSYADFGDAENFPWTSPYSFTYNTEAYAWGEWIKKNLKDYLPVTVGALVMDNDFGLSYALPFKEYALNNPDVISDFFSVRHDLGSFNFTDDMLTISDYNPDVFISMTAGQACVSVMKELKETGLKDRVLAAFTPSVCNSIENYMKPAKMAGNNFYSIKNKEKIYNDANGWNDTVDSIFKEFIKDLISIAGKDFSNTLIWDGIERGYFITETLRIADKLPGGLSRTNFLIAMRNLKISSPFDVVNYKYSLGGATKPYLDELVDEKI